MEFREALERVYREERDRILATLFGMLRNVDLAEEMMQDAFAAALSQWGERGVPENPRAWIVGTARHKALDRLRRDARFRETFPDLERLGEREEPPVDTSGNPIGDDRLRLIFTCCHPALATESQVALTLRTLCGMTTEEIARVFLVVPATMAQRLVRVQRKIAQARIPYSVPPVEMLGDRLEPVLATVYLIFTAGYTATSGEALVRKDLCAEAIRLGRLLVELVPGETEPAALLALMLFHDSRRAARTDQQGGLVLLEDQNRELWNRAHIREGVRLLDSALRRGAGASRYGVEASIAALHATAAHPEETDWRQILALYGVLGRVAPSPVVALNQAVAVAMVEGAEAGLARLAALERDGELRSYHLLPAAQAGLLGKLGRWGEAIGYYRRAIALVRNDAERAFLEGRLADASILCDAEDAVRGENE